MTRTSTPRPLGLHQITAMDLEPAALVKVARDTGYSEVCVFTHIPEIDGSRPSFPLVTPTTKQDVLTAMSDDNIAIANIEFFSIFEHTEINAFRQGLELGHELGARCAVTHIFDPERARAEASLGRLAELASEYSLDVAIETMGATLPCNSIAKTLQYITAVNRPNLGIAIDMLHMVRTGTTLTDIKAIPSELIKYAQVCDGRSLDVSADYMEEALTARLIPGDGCFPIAGLLQALPALIPIDVEIPNLNRQQQGIGAAQFAKDAFDATQRLLSHANRDAE